MVLEIDKMSRIDFKKRKRSNSIFKKPVNTKRRKVTKRRTFRTKKKPITSYYTKTGVSSGFFTSKNFTGVSNAKDVQGNVTDAKCVYVAHNDSPMQTRLKYMWYAIYKRLMKEGGITFLDWNEPKLPAISATDTLEIHWTKEAGQAISSIPTAAIGATYVTHLDVAELFWGLCFGSLINDTPAPAINFGPGAYLNGVRWNRASGDYVYLNLRDATAKLKNVSSLKLQNRTITVGTDAEDVDNVPLNMIKYYGKGNYLRPFDDGGGVKPCDVITGRFDTAASTNVNIQEPPEKNQVKGCLTRKFMSLMPGKIYTSTMSNITSVNLDKLMRSVSWQYKSVADTNMISPFGSTCLFAFDKKIGQGPNIIVYYEVELLTYAFLSLKPLTLTARINNV